MALSSPDSRNMLDHRGEKGLDLRTMNCSSMWKCGGRLALALVAGGLLSACGTSIVPQSTGGAVSEDPVAAAAKTQREFDEYWARKRQGGEPASAPAPAPEPEAVASSEPAASPEPVAEAPSQPNTRRTFSQWWGDRKQQKAEESAPEVAEAPAPAPQPTAAAPAEAPAQKNQRRTFSQWWDDRKKQKEQVAEAQSAPADSQPVAEAPQAEPEKQKTVLPIVAWFDERKKNKKGGDVDLSNIDLSGDFPTARPVKDWSGFVHSPYDDRFIDVKGVPSGTLVADPRFDISERKFFIVP